MTTSTERLAVFAGTFDPVTYGHLDLVERSAALFDRVVVAVLVNPAKSPLLSLDDRLRLLRVAVARWPTVEVDTFEGLLVDYVARRQAAATIRGIRSTSEFVDESQMALMNRHLNPQCETVFLASSAAHLHISSRLVREIAALGGPLRGLVPEHVAEALVRRPR